MRHAQIIRSGGYANGMRDLLTVLGVDKVTVVGHSLGGGVAMQFAYQFPERSERVVLVSTGGLGPQVTPLIRMLTIPGAGYAMRVATFPLWRPIVAESFRALGRMPFMVTKDFGEIADVYERLADPGATCRRAPGYEYGPRLAWTVRHHGRSHLSSPADAGDGRVGA